MVDRLDAEALRAVDPTERGRRVSTHERKARKRAGIPFVKARKRPTRPYRQPGLGLMSYPEYMARRLGRAH